MINRLYLPFHSTREYQDEKTDKLFLSERISYLELENNKITFLFEVIIERKLLLLS